MRPAALEEIELIVAERTADLERRIAPEALTVRDVARRLKLSVSRVNELVSTGEIESYRIGRLRRIDPTALAAFIAERRRASAVPPAASAKAQAVMSGASWLADLRQEVYGD